MKTVGRYVSPNTNRTEPPGLPAAARTAKTGRWRGAAFVVLLAAPVLSTGCNNAAKKQADQKPLDVQVSLPIVAKDITDYEEFTGQIESKLTVQLQARVDGYLKEIHFEEGQIVKKDAPLFVIDPKPFVAKWNQAKAAVKVGEAKKENTSYDYDRATKLFKSNNLTKEQFDAAKGAYDEAIANLDALKALEESAKLDVDYCTISAPFDGTMSKRFVDPDNMVKSGSTVLSSIVSINPLYVYFSIDERTVLKVQRLVEKGEFKKPRDAIKRVLLGLGDQAKDVYPFEGKLDFLDNKIDPGTGTLLVRGVFDNDKDAKGLLYPGLFARIKLPIGNKHEALLISERALGTDQGQKFVYVVNDRNEVEYRKVRVGSMQQGLRVVEEPVKKDGKIVEGVLPGEKIVVSGVQKVRGGQKVNPTVVAMPVGSSLQQLHVSTTPGAGGKDGKAPAAHH